MNKTLTLIAAVVISALPMVAQTPSKVPSGNAAQGDAIKWTKTSHDFGTVPMGPPAEVTFKFTNNGAVPIVIKSANPSCGCTTPTYTKTPVMPGESGEVKASYGTDGRPGYFQKTITVTFDNGLVTTLTIQGTVSTDTQQKKDELK